MKKHLALAAVKYASKILGLSEIEVIFRQESFFNNSEINAVFNDKYYLIIFNEDWMNQVTKSEIIITAFHETRHAYQKANIEFPEYFMGRESEETINKWQKDFENYKGPLVKGNSLIDLQYINQEIEIDAIKFAQQHLNLMLKDYSM